MEEKERERRRAKIFQLNIYLVQKRKENGKEVTLTLCSFQDRLSFDILWLLKFLEILDQILIFSSGSC